MRKPWAACLLARLRVRYPPLLWSSVACGAAGRRWWEEKGGNDRASEVSGVRRRQSCSCECLDLLREDGT